MYIVIVGGGKVGYYLAKTLLPNKHKITVIESKRELCEKIANDLNIAVINGDGTNIDYLREANVEKAQIFIALTGRDEDNLIACQLAKRNFGVKRAISRVNNPKNITVIKQLGVDIAVSSTSIIADLIEQEVDYTGMKTLMKLKGGKVVLSEIIVMPDYPICEKPLKDLDIPGKCVLISVIRDEEVIIPNGETILRSGDLIIISSSEEDQEELRKYMMK